jgi:hypothetical protein
MCSRERTLARLSGALLLAGLSFAAAAEDSRSVWLLTAGAELDDEDGYRVDLGATWAPTRATSVSAYAGSADTSTDFNNFASRMAGLALDHSFGQVEASLELRWWGDSELFESRAVAAGLYYREQGWRFGLRGELRESDFDPIPFDVEIPIRNLIVPVSGTARCGLDNTGYGASVSHTGKSWSVLLAGTQYEYSSTDCALSDLAVPPQAGNVPPINRQLFRRIADAVLTRGADLLGSALTRENGFLDYSLWGSVALRSGLNTYGLDYFHDREEFQGLVADTLVGSVTFPVSNRLDLELRMGATDSELSGTVAFAGLTLFVFLAQ